MLSTIEPEAMAALCQSPRRDEEVNYQVAAMEAGAYGRARISRRAVSSRSSHLDRRIDDAPASV
jgi:hypothetical protein